MRKVQFYLLIIALLFLGFWTAKILSWQTFKTYTKNLQATEEDITQNYKENLDKNPVTASKLVKDGVRFLKGGETDLAQVALEQATKQDPKYRDAFVYLGNVYLQQNQNQKALEALEKAKDLDPLHPYTWQLLSVAYQRLGQEEKASEAAGKAKEFEKK
ncbi:MAG: hypothetical protein COX39_02500 [Candidatus Nealsonbacteria bacterium CG23_combo_of_CG06-09_8_20_14_all_40_13]|uniref:Uncharacterized protein n=1 Tax=Candidatus Nealsonbacteria bacterium CG23_combo_of_CG06-09_8_20_14_all_40_13 TaxID=1974724 RepID=A0A2G9YQT3_9BACT|nr:MAG: hypothetical protein COX39_02500 [Candidatus Nealsonbacteria bacterium CG23_combo_of_CG06-09_8_20_14_all_40_13]PIR70899.1 MAG: hypothetical protein COU44_02650 [Candidatus Nealsonbacteria bacterium CG10_big_fil_rev_8_21_14_0_10_40_24]PIU42996.1 MAG: hypothetical protein COS97_03435 [Candidatus Nealsonbacteria bacterium CG07_land_8_20_14_0_80_40_10]